jgi:hypothetical protein
MKAGFRGGKERGKDTVSQKSVKPLEKSGCAGSGAMLRR